MTKVERRFIQSGVLAVVAFACFAEVLYLFVFPDRVIWQIELPGGSDVVLDSHPVYSFSVRTWPYVIVAIAPGLAFALAGLIAWSVRPRNRVGLLIMGVGVGLLIGVRPGSKSSSAFSGMVSQILFPWTGIALVLVGALGVVMLIHLLLAFPGGRLVSGLDRALVRSFYVALPLAAILGGAGNYVPPHTLGIFGGLGSAIDGNATALPNVI